jgi:pyruvate dehydrogenase E2 component (dihydrolipoamide acetyltransferase)
MPDVTMPRLSDSMQEGAINRWLVDDQSYVVRGQEILEVETDKAIMTYEAENEGTLTILLHEGENIDVGQIIARID